MGRSKLNLLLAVAMACVLPAAARAAPTGQHGAVPSSGIRVAFTQNNNVYLMDTNGGNRRAVTTDGTSGYAGRAPASTGEDVSLGTRVADGMTWTRRASGTSSDLNGVSCPNARLCVAVGGKQDPSSGLPVAGVILTSADGGATWKRRTSGTNKQLYGVNCRSANACVAVGNFGTILTSADGGATWTNRSSSNGFVLHNISCPSTSLCVAVGEGPILTSADSGATWTSHSFSAGFSDVGCPNARFCVATGPGNILTSTDGGGAWTPRISDPTFGGEGVSCPSASACVAVGAAGVVLTSINGGTTWTHRTFDTSNTLQAVSCANASACVAVGWGENFHGVILTSADGGAAWTRRTSGVNSRLQAISCTSADACVAVGANGTILQGRSCSSTCTLFKTPKMTTFNTPTPNSGLGFIAAAPDGGVWFLESRSNKIGRITPEGKIEEFVIPGSATGHVSNMIVAPNGDVWFAMWFTKGSQIGRISPRGAIDLFPIQPPAPGLSGGEIPSLLAGQDGSLWFGAGFAGKIGHITAQESVTEFKAPFLPSDSQTGPPSLWYGSVYTGEIGEIGEITADGQIRRFRVAAPFYNGQSSQPSLGDIAVSPDGSMWFTAPDYGLPPATKPGYVGELLPGGHIRTLPLSADPVTVAPSGAVWFSDAEHNWIIRFSPGGTK